MAFESVNNEFGLKSEAQGTVLSVPVDQVFKIQGKKQDRCETKITSI